MLKTRIIGVVLVKDGIAVQSIDFRRYLPIGQPEIAINFLDRWGIDEIVLLHIDAAADGASPLADQVRSYARQCQVPLSVGGGISTLGDVKRIIQAGADKVVINSALISNPALITEVAAHFGSQCIVISIDARRWSDGNFMAFTHGGRKPTEKSPSQLAREAELLGAGEIFLTSIDRDGSKRGYDIDLIRSVVDAVKMPVIACGGAGHPVHLQSAIHCGASAVAAGNFFHFTEHSVITVKQYLASSSEAVRLDSYATYEKFSFDCDGRLEKQPCEVLEALRFHYIPEEVI